MTLTIEIIVLVGTHILLAIIGWSIGKYYTEKKIIRDFYKGLKPIIALVADFRKKDKISKDQARLFIQTTSKSFKENFEIGNMLTIDFGEYDNQTKIECGICGDLENKVSRNNICSNCDLNCSIWNFK